LFPRNALLKHAIPEDKTYYEVTTVMEMIKDFEAAGKTEATEHIGKKTYTVTEIAKFTSIPVYTLRKLIRDKVIPAYKVTAKSYLLDLEEVVAVIKKHRV